MSRFRVVLLTVVFLAAAAIAAFMIYNRFFPRRPPTRAFASDMVRGYLAAAVGNSRQAETSGGLYAREVEGKDIYLPGVTIYLEDPQSGRLSDEVRTDLSGRFTVRVPGEARYRLCWKSQVYGDGCLKDLFVAGREALFLSTVLISVPRREGFVASYGKVRFEDDSVPRALEPLADVNSFAVVSLVDSGRNMIAEVPVNNFGDYLLPHLPGKEAVQLVARVEGAQGEQNIRPEAYTKFPRLVRYHLTIKNSRPRLNAIVPVSAATGKRVQVGTPGDTLVLKAESRDRDKDPLQISWAESAGGGTLSAKTGDEVRWTLPKSPGRYSVEAVASDRKGGYDRYTVRLSVGAPGVAFSGVVAGTDGTLLDGADVEVNGQVEKTDPKGRFTSYAPPADRYVFNIRKKGYGFYSKIYDGGVAGGRWTLPLATVANFDPRNEINLQDKRSERNCQGPPTARVNWREKGALTNVWWQDGQGNNIPPPLAVDERDSSKRALLPWRERPKQVPCGPGISVRIPANGLKTSSGGAPDGQVELSLSTVDLDTPEQMPGDDSVERRDGRVDWMQSYGAGSVELRDTATGERLFLDSAVEADVSIPVDRSQVAAGAPLPETMPLLTYDEAKGVWREDGQMRLDVAKQNYVAKVRHFSSLNADVVFTEQACVGVQSTLSTPYDLEVTIPMPNGAAPKVKLITITDAPPHVIYNLPRDTNVTIVAIAPGSGATPPRVLGVFVANTGAPNDQSFGTPPPASVCGGQVVLSAQDFPDIAAGGEFLHGLFSFAATTINEADIPVAGTISQQLDAATTNYYNSVDPAGDRDTFTKFRARNGFTKPPGFQLCSGAVCENPDDEINVAFANSGDLGFGRDMHCRRTATASGFDFACYVTNFGDITTDDALDATEARNTTPGAANATVAMEFSRILNTDAVEDRHVKFYVFVGETRVNNADLDGKGRRPIPQLCMVCHSGAYPGGGTIGVPTFNTPASVKMGSRFLPFDLRFYSFPASPDKGAQQSAIKHLNEDIVRNAPSLAPAPDPIAEVIAAMYDGSSTQKEEFVVPGWAQTTLPNTPAQEQFYKRVVGNTCRTCHQAQPFANVSAERAGVDLQFRTARDFLRSQSITGGGTSSPFSAAEQRVCSEHVMPHALRTHEIFWGQYWQNDFGGISPTVAAQFQAFGDTMKALPRPAGWPGAESWPPAWNGGICGDFSGPTVPPSYYSDFVHPMWGRNYGTGASSGCATCHSNLSGNAAATRAAMLDPGGLFGGGQAVTPNDATNSLVFKRLTGSTAGTRMPQNCPIPQRRCLNQAGGIYNPATDTNPVDTTFEINRIVHWINNGATP